MSELCLSALTPVRADGRRAPGPQALGPADRKPGILVVDDEPSLRDLLQRGLGQYGFRVWAAADGWQALDLYQDLRAEIDVVLLDVLMPELDGPGTLRILQWQHGEVPACFMSGCTGPYTADGLLACGALHVFPKPFQLDELARALRQLTEAVRGTACADKTSPRGSAAASPRGADGERRA